MRCGYIMKQRDAVWLHVAGDKMHAHLDKAMRLKVPYKRTCMMNQCALPLIALVMQTGDLPGWRFPL